MKFTIALFVLLAIALGSVEAQNPNNGFSLDDVRGEVEAKSQRLKAMTDAYNQVMEILSDDSESSNTKEIIRNRFLQHFAEDLDWTGEDEDMKMMVRNGFLFTDTRDGTRYAAIRIGNQVWMAQNLAYKPSRGGFWAYENNQANVRKYGYLYDWNTALRVCPTGWRLPSHQDWKVLKNHLGSDNGHKMKSRMGFGAGNGSNASGFNALPSGHHEDDDGTFHHRGTHTTFWSSTENESTAAWAPQLISNQSDLFTMVSFEKSPGFSVRCLRD
jgi:uncharacterized protein (TIGR02145 family)